MVSALNECSEFSFDIETTGLSPLDSRILLVQVGVGDDQYVIDYARVNIDRLLPYLVGLNYRTIIHNVKFESAFMWYYHHTIIGNPWDTFLAERVINPDLLSGGSLADVTQRYLNRTLNKEIRKSFYEDGSSEFSEEQIAYAAEDVEVLLPIQKIQEEKLQSMELTHIARLEFDVAPVVARMELTGIPVDVVGWKKTIGEYKVKQIQQTDLMYHELFDKGGLDEQLGMFERSAINLESNKQMLQAFQDLGINVQATDERTLGRINHPAAKALMEYRKIAKILTSYDSTFLDKVHPFDNRIHPDFMQLGTETGRFSCRNPNIQQIPPELRKYIHDPEYKMIAADYAQIELRVLAQVSGDQRLVDAFNSGQDLHRSTASIMFNIPIENVTKEQRSLAKTLNFGILYGMGGPKLQDKLNETREEGNKLTLTEVKDIHSRYKNTYRRAIAWLGAAGNHAWDYLESKTIYGRKRFYTRPTGAVDQEQYTRMMMGLKRQGANSVIQGTSADMTKMAMLGLQDQLDYDGYRANIIIQVHDELVVLAHKSQAEAVSLVVRESMKSAGERLINKVPIEVDVHISDVWSKE